MIIITGVLIGLSTSLLDTGYKWVSGLKTGVCTTGFFKTYASCCPELTTASTATAAATCESWKQWDQVIGLDSNTAGSSIYKFVLFTFTSLILATLAALVCHNEQFVKTSGISETKTLISGVIINGFLSLRTLLAKWSGLLLIVSSGFWAGKEGPLVHISLGLAELIIQRFPQLDSNHAGKREVLLAATAAGISVAFNAPISGVIFTLEQLTSFFNPSDKMWMSFVCSMTGVVVLNFFNGSLEIYVKMDNQWLSFELIGFILLGVLGGVYGAVFNRLNLWFAKWRRETIESRGGKWEIFEIMGLSLATSVLTYPLILPRLPLTSLIAILFKECDPDPESASEVLCEGNTSGVIFLLLFTFVAGTFLTAYTFGTIVPAGILMPSLVLGAIGGRVLGLIFEKIQNSSATLTDLCSSSHEMCISPAAYAVVGSAAFLAGVTKMTVWCVVTVFELTGALTYVLPIMITVIVARSVNDMFDQVNCYDYWIEFFKYPYLHEVQESSLPVVKVKDVFSQNLKFERSLVFCTDEPISVAQLKNCVRNHEEFQGVPILNNSAERFVLGWVSLSDLEDELTTLELDKVADSKQVTFFLSADRELLDLSHIVERFYTVVTSDTLLSDLADIFFKLKARYVIVCDDGQFNGIVTLKDVSDMVKLDASKINEIATSHY